MGDITITEEVVMEIKFIIEQGAGHLKGRIEVGKMTEVGTTVGFDQVLGQVQIETELNVSNVEGTIIFHENVQLG